MDDALMRGTLGRYDESGVAPNAHAGLAEPSGPAYRRPLGRRKIRGHGLRHGADCTFTRMNRCAAVAGVKLSRTFSVEALFVIIVVVAMLNAASSGLPAVSTV